MKPAPVRKINLRRMWNFRFAKLAKACDFLFANFLAVSERRQLSVNAAYYQTALTPSSSSCTCSGGRGAAHAARDLHPQRGHGEG